MKHQELTRRIIGAFFDVYNELGHGFLESVYVEALDLALKESGLAVIREMPLRVHFRNTVVGVFRADLVVAGAVLVEVKACQCLNASHKAQALNYLRATILEVGLILNFGPQPAVKRLLFDNPLKTTKRKVHGERARSFNCSGNDPYQSDAIRGKVSLAQADRVP